MSVIHAIILGIIQGITEFLPVSSFGHLCGVQDLLGGTRGSGVLFEVMLHLGTMIALILVFLKDIKKIGIELIGMILDLIGNANIFLYNRRTGKELTYAKIISGTYRKLTALIMVSTIPTVLIGYQCKRLVVRSASSHMFSGIGILLTGVILLVEGFRSRKTCEWQQGNKRNQLRRCYVDGYLPGSFCVSGPFQAWPYHERRTFLRPRTEVCSEIFAADEHSGCGGSFFCGDGRVHFCSYDCWPGIYLCSWNDRGRDHRLSGDPFYA